MAGATFTSEMERYKENHNLCLSSNITAERLALYGAPADKCNIGYHKMLCNSTTCLLSETYTILQQLQELITLSDPIGTCLPSTCTKNPNHEIHFPRMCLHKAMFLGFLSKTHGSSVLLKCVYSIAR